VQTLLLLVLAGQPRAQSGIWTIPTPPSEPPMSSRNGG